MSKHISLREYRIQDYQIDGMIRPLWIPTAFNVADHFTKITSKLIFSKFCPLLGVHTPSVTTSAFASDYDFPEYNATSHSCLSLVDVALEHGLTLPDDYQDFVVYYHPTSRQT